MGGNDSLTSRVSTNYFLEDPHSYPFLFFQLGHEHCTQGARTHCVFPVVPNFVDIGAGALPWSVERRGVTERADCTVG